MQSDLIELNRMEWNGDDLKCDILNLFQGRERGERRREEGEGEKDTQILQSTLMVTYMHACMHTIRLRNDPTVQINPIQTIRRMMMKNHLKA